MTTLRLGQYDFFQTYDDFQAYSPALMQRQSLLEQFKEKMPDEVIESYLSDQSQEQGTDRIDYYSFSQNTPLTERKKAPVFFIESKPLGERAISLQKWRGIVEEVGKGYFTAKLINLTDKGYDEHAEISNDEITQEDIELIHPGAVFYWSIGYSHSSTGQRRRFSDIRFRRIPVWNNKEINIAREKAKRISNLIKWK